MWKNIFPKSSAQVKMGRIVFPAISWISCHRHMLNTVNVRKFLGLGSVNGERELAEVGRGLIPIQLLPSFLHCAKIHADLSSVPALIESWNGLLGARQTEIYSTACSEMALAVLSASKTEGLTAWFQSLSGLSRRKTLIQAPHLNFEGNVISKFCICLWRTVELSRTVQLLKSTGSFSVLSPSVC